MGILNDSLMESLAEIQERAANIAYGQPTYDSAYLHNMTCRDSCSASCHVQCAYECGGVGASDLYS